MVAEAAEVRVARSPNRAKNDQGMQAIRWQVSP